MANILVVGSSNTDMVVKTDRFPEPGETIIGGDFFIFPGGKGANQAVAAARLGGAVTFVSRLGVDIFGDQAIEGFEKENIDTTFITRDEQHPSGVALITVNKEGENEIVVASGANGQLSREDIDKATRTLENMDIVLTQLECPLDVIEYMIERAHYLAKRVILNPAPAQKLSPQTLDGLYCITPNETEAEILTGIVVKTIDDAERAATELISQGVINVVITMGASGSFYKSASEMFFLKANRVEAIDTTAAGDVFNGALAVALAAGKQWKPAMQFATDAAGISVSRMGAQASAPFLREIA